MFNKITKKIQSLPDRKRYIDFIAALFALPVMITVLIINLGNLQKQDQNSPTPLPQPNTIVIETTPSNSDNSVPQTTQSCKKKVGPIAISSPEEGQMLTSNPVNIVIRYDDTDYCSVVWSYRINNGEWSEFSANSISLYNPPEGKVVFDLRVQSTASQDTTELSRTFEFKSSTQIASQSATTE